MSSVSRNIAGADGFDCAISTEHYGFAFVLFVTWIHARPFEILYVYAI